MHVVLRINVTAATDLAVFECRQSKPKIFATNHKIKHFIKLIKNLSYKMRISIYFQFSFLKLYISIFFKRYNVHYL